MKQPEIRFKGFDGEWELVTFKDISNGFNYGINAAAKPYDGLNKYLRITDIDDSMRVFDKSNLTSPNAKDINMYLLQEGDITFARTGASVGKTYIYNKQDGKVVYAGFLIRMQLKDSVCPHFIFYNTLTTNYFNYIDIVSQRSGQPGVNSKEYGDYSLNIPITIKEQQAIADYFKSLDSLIQTTTKKIASLKQMKSASLVSIFPQEGETKPRVRFKGFEGEWQIKKFSDLYERSILKNDLSYGSDKIISVANMYFLNSRINPNDGYLKSYNVMHLGDIAFEGNKSKKFAHGRFVENTIGDGIVSHVFIVLTPKSKKYDLYFWKYYINNESIMGKILLKSTKSSTMMTDLVVNDFLKESILVPSYEEQVKIGIFFNSVDFQISLQERRLEKLKQIKSACLDKMFV